MKIISKITNAIIIVALILTASSCGNDDDGNVIIPTDDNIVAIATGDSDLSLLVTALAAADGDLVSILNGTGPFTVLAPTDTAMQAFLTANNYADINAIPTDELQQLLLNHVIPGEISSTTLTNNVAGYAETSSTAGPNGSTISIYYNTANGVVFNGGATVSTPDIAASNGIIHKIDAVIELPDVTTFATADPNFSRLVEALTAYSFDYVTTLQGEGPFTVFAPNNTAFDALLDVNNNWTVPGDIEETVLTNALNLHVVPSSNVREADLVDGNLTTLSKEITIDVAAKTIRLEGNDPASASTIIFTDVQATNGIIHVIDKVVLDLPSIDPN
ncbi:Uncaracterized surface protein containing fasciclin (FAS1) repeats [Aquimarina amphilecti]|uniref:Uncaracterized surface protein containing fasciclin (FAS1) repeats n=1 Tax=Aquimarina amphilecti TaxID=1038014 RepID=A0A1H7PSW8_AQUAM|nr:fasciclin domain-containing protein [Aquimarina amphilecti]SEL38699.1 Uncaracterized surface protein containing fasciclin (FAS1) repeats [Aquimarina amphilecti]